MSKNMIKKAVFLIFSTLLIVFLVQLPSNAVGYSVNSGKTKMTPGETTTFTVSVNGGGGVFTINSSDSSVVSIEGDTKPWIEDGNHSITLKALKQGKATIKVIPGNVADSTTATDVKLDPKSITIEVVNPTPPANNNGNNQGGTVDTSGANLKSITVAGKTYNNPSTDMTITVPSTVGAVDISAVPSNSGAKVSGTGAKELVTGTNTATITVTAPNGAKKTYTIRIRKLADTSSTPNVIEEPKNNGEPEEPVPEIIDLRLTYLRIEDVELTPQFDPETFEYRVEVTNKDKLDIVAVQNVEDAILEITGDTDLQDGENEVLIAIKKEGQQEVQYRITVIKTTEQVILPEEVSGDEEAGGFLSTAGGKVVVVGVGIIAIGGLGFAIWKAKTSSGMGTRARKVSSRKSMFDDFD